VFFVGIIFKDSSFNKGGTMKKFKSTRTNRHHKKSRSRGGDNSPQNISIVNAKQHTAFHLLHPNNHPQAICDVLNSTWIDPDYVLICVKKETVKGIQKLIRQLT
jgi:hypothetical protein